MIERIVNLKPITISNEIIPLNLEKKSKEL